MHEILQCISLSALLTGLVFLIHRKDRLGTDEAYLWYGVLRTIDGKIPLRDFHSYEPGRYYWCTLLIRILGSDIFGLRLAIHIFYFTGLSAGIVALRLSGHDWPSVIGAAIILSTWAYPSHKLFESSLLIWAIFAGVLMIGFQAPATFILCGLVVGIATIFGINYGLYTGSGLFALALLIGLKAPNINVIYSTGFFTLGIFIGVLPFFLMFVTIPGYLNAFWQKRVRIIFERGTTNINLPIPWPWRSVPHSLLRLKSSGRYFIQLYFFLLPIFSWGVVLWACFASLSQLQEKTAMLSAAFIGAISLHHAMSRADVPHLGQSIAPLIIGLFSMFSGSLVGWIVIAVVFGWGTIVTVVYMYPGSERKRRPESYSETEIGGSMLWMPNTLARLIEAVRRLVIERVQPDGSVLALPKLIELYPVLGLLAPVYDIFCIFPASYEEEEDMLRSIEMSRVKLAVIDDSTLDGREELRFSNTHPHVWGYLRDNFTALEIADIPRDIHILCSP